MGQMDETLVKGSEVKDIVTTTESIGITESDIAEHFKYFLRVSMLEQDVRVKLASPIEFLDKELEDYYRFVLEKSEGEAKEQIPNSGMGHAAIMMASMFDKTSNFCKLAVGCFSGDVSNNPIYLKALNSAISRGVKFDIIIFDDLNPDSLASYLLFKYSEDYPGNVIIRRVTDKAVLRSFNPKVLHWSTFDDLHFRLEIEPAEYKAFGAFNDSEMAGKLNYVFTKIAADCTEPFSFHEHFRHITNYYTGSKVVEPAS